MRTWLPALLIGLCLGVAALLFPPLGLPLALIVPIGLGILHWRQHRLADIGWLFVGLGAFPAVMLGWGALYSVVDPGSHVFGATWAGLILSVTAIGIGLAVVVVGRWDRRADL